MGGQKWRTAGDLLVGLKSGLYSEMSDTIMCPITPTILFNGFVTCQHMCYALRRCAVCCDDGMFRWESQHAMTNGRLLGRTMERPDDHPNLFIRIKCEQHLLFHGPCPQEVLEINIKN